MTKTQIINAVETLTEKKGKQLDLPTMFNTRLQKFCSEHRYWWRKKTFTFNTVGNVPTYDVTDSAVGVSPALAGIEMEEVTKVYLVLSPTNIAELDPVTDDEAVVAVIEETTAIVPDRYLIDPAGNPGVLRFPVPNGAYKIRVFAWCLPVIADSTSGDDIPLVPKHLHHILIDGLRMDVFESLYGTQDQKYLTARSEYTDGVARAKKKTRFTSSQQGAPEWRSTEDAVRSTY